MSPPPDNQWRPPDAPNRPPRPSGGSGKPAPRPRWVPWVIVGLLVAIFLFWQAAPGSTPEREKLKYGDFITLVKQNRVDSVTIESATGKVTGKFASGYAPHGHNEFTTQGQEKAIPDADVALMDQHGVERNYKGESSNILATILVWVVPLALLGLIWWFIARRAQGQMGAVMNIGRSRAKVYNTEKPKTTFADVAGYGAVKQ